MHNGCGDDDTSTELAHGNNQSTVHTDRCEPRCQNWCKYTDGAGHENDEKKAYSQWNVVVVVGCSATHVNCSTLSINAMPESC